MSATNYSNDRQASVDVEYGADPASGSFFNTDFKRHDDLKLMLDGNKDSLKLEAMKRIISMVAKGKDVSDLFPAVVKNVVSSNLEVKKLVYVYLVRYAEEQQDLALLSISTFQRGLKDPNPLIRACALRVLSSVRVHVIAPIMMLAIKETVMDLSPYVRKTTAHAIPKLFSLDPEQKDELVKVIEKLLSDMSTLVVGSAVMAFEEVCPERIDLIHANYRKLCCMLVDVEEWGQIVIMNMLTRYARTQFLDPNQGKLAEENEEEKPFYEDKQPEDGKESNIMDPDHRLLLSNSRPLLLSRNASVVLSVAQLYQHIGPHAEVGQVAKALVRLLRSHREVQVVVLTNIASLSTRKKGMFEPFLKSFFIRSNDPTQIKVLKLEVITNIASETNISLILREFQTYIWSPDKEFVVATIQAIGRCASNIREVTDSCLSGLVSLFSNKDELVVGESVVVVRKLLQNETVGHKDIITHMARLVDNIKMPTARASILWLLGEYCNKVPKIAPDVLRKTAKSFINEADMVKLQIMTLATKLYLTNPKQTHMLCQYVLNLAKYDVNYDIRDRARFIRALIFSHGATDNEGQIGLSKCVRKIFLAPKPTPIQQSSFKDRNHFQLGTLSHMINAHAVGYRDLPPFPEVAPDRSVRDLKDEERNGVPKRSTYVKEIHKTSKFYSDEEETDESDSGSDASSSSSSSSNSGSESNSDSESEMDGSATDYEYQKSNPVTEKNLIFENNAKGHQSSDEDVSSSSSSSDSSSDESSSNSDEDLFTEPKKSSHEDRKKEAQPKSNLDLLLDINPLSIAAPILTPSSAQNFDETQSSIQEASPLFIPSTSLEILNRITGNGLSIQARFTRSPHLYSPSLTSIELTFRNESNESFNGVSVSSNENQGGSAVHGFSPIPTLCPGAQVQGTIGIDFKDSITPVHFKVIVDGKSCPVTITPHIGELLLPVSISEKDFEHFQGKLRGLNEQVGSIRVQNHLDDEGSMLEKVYQNVNVLRIPSSDGSGVIRFAGQTRSGKSLVLITLQNEDNSPKMTLRVNCEKMMVASMLFKQFEEIFSA